jgi:Na+/H+ antiporter NhaA
VATVVDTTALWQTVAGSLVAGIGVTLAFSIAILGFARSIDARADGRSAASAVFGVLAVLALAGVGAAVVLAVIVMTSK